jgi:hypothetical protein
MIRLRCTGSLQSNDVDVRAVPKSSDRAIPPARAIPTSARRGASPVWLAVHDTDAHRRRVV